MENTKNCTSCKHSYILENFIGLKGQECKVCNTCRQKVAERDKLASTKARKKELLVGTNKKAIYSKQYREKQKAENPEKYIEQNKIKRAKWRENWMKENKNWRKTNVKSCIANLKLSAKKRNIHVLLTDDAIANFIQGSCFYCGESNLENKLNGIDRLDHNNSYNEDNCVSSCSNCNMTKACLDALTFVQRCNHIASQHYPDEIEFNNKYLEAWPINAIIPCYNFYKYRAKKKDLEFDISFDDFSTLSLQPCYYCKQKATNGHGLDRINNNFNYTKTNVVSCCSECNYMKGTKEQKDFLEKCKTVALYCSFTKKNI